MSQLLFPYDLPAERIAQRPAAPGTSLLLHASLRGPEDPVEIVDRKFAELPELLRTQDLLVLNNSRVLPARFFPPGVGENAEVLLLRRIQENADDAAPGEELWEALARPMKKCERAQRLQLSPHLEARVCGRSESGSTLQLALRTAAAGSTVQETISREGRMPIPPYIRQGRADEHDSERYQTVYAEVAGSVAAPTAGLHFTEQLFARLRASGIDYTFVTHHVGPASFLPVRDGDWSQHQMDSESFSIPEAAVAKITHCQAAGGRIIAVGTTSVRALESHFGSAIGVTDGFSTTDLFITPGYTFRAVDALITNFHQPLSTHLLLVAAFSGVAQCESMYRHALAHKYRFLSYGDGMFIERGAIGE